MVVDKTFLCMLNEPPTNLLEARSDKQTQNDDGQEAAGKLAFLRLSSLFPPWGGSFPFLGIARYVRSVSDLSYGVDY
jgi:hypothetical protein